MHYKDARFFGNLGKCTFYTNRVLFLGYVVTPRGFEVDKSKIEGIQSWPPPRTVTQVRSLLGLGVLYALCEIFSTIAALLNELRRKDAPFVWGSM